MKALVDEQLPVALARWITARGHVADHVSEIGLSGRPDRDVARRAVTGDAVIFTKDADFVAFALQEPAARIVWLRVGNVSNEILLARIDELWPELFARLDAGERLIEAR